MNRDLVWYVWWVSCHGDCLMRTIRVDELNSSQCYSVPTPSPKGDIRDKGLISLPNLPLLCPHPLSTHSTTSNTPFWTQPSPSHTPLTHLRVPPLPYLPTHPTAPPPLISHNTPFTTPSHPTIPIYPTLSILHSSPHPLFTPAPPTHLHLLHPTPTPPQPFRPHPTTPHAFHPHSK